MMSIFRMKEIGGQDGHGDYLFNTLATIFSIRLPCPSLPDPCNAPKICFSTILPRRSTSTLTLSPTFFSATTVRA